VKDGKTVDQFNEIKSTFAEEYQTDRTGFDGGDWNAAYDMWFNNWSKEVMIWNEWNGKTGYWPNQATIQVDIGGVPYKFLKNGSVLNFFRVTEVKSGEVDILAALKWLQANGHVTTTDILTQIEYGVEICSTNGVDQRFDTTGFTLSIS